MKKTYLNKISPKLYKLLNIKKKKNRLCYFGIDISNEVIKKNKNISITSLKQIQNNISFLTNCFQKSILKFGYKGKYNYCYCTKSNHLKKVFEVAYKSCNNIETSSEIDIDILLYLEKYKKLNKKSFFIHNGPKTKNYLKKIILLNSLGFYNTIIVVDSINEIIKLKKLNVNKKIKIGIRIAVKRLKNNFDENRFGIDKKGILELYGVLKNTNLELKMVHFFYESFKTKEYFNTLYYVAKVYCELKNKFNNLNSINIGGGLAVNKKNNYYENFSNKTIDIIKNVSDSNNIEHPNIFSEYGKFSISNSTACFFKVIEKKEIYNNKWLFLKASIVNSIPDMWILNSNFPILAMNHLNKKYTKVIIGGISCDSDDYIKKPLYVPKIKTKKKLIIGIFNTGAYQNAIGSYSRFGHCLIEKPILSYIDLEGNLVYEKENNLKDDVLKTLGYKQL